MKISYKLNKFLLTFYFIMSLPVFSSELQVENKQSLRVPILSRVSYVEDLTQKEIFVPKISAIYILPLEIWSQTFEYIEGKNFEKLAFVCKDFYQLHQSSRLLHLRCNEYFCDISKDRFAEEQEYFDLSNKELVCQKLKSISSMLEHSSISEPENVKELIHNWQLFYGMSIMRIQLGDMGANDDLKKQLDAKKRAIKNFPGYYEGTIESKKRDHAIELTAFAQFCYSSYLSIDEIEHIFHIASNTKQEYMQFYAQSNLLSILALSNLKDFFIVQGKQS
ncbi:MAG: hypothetical protein H0U27_05780 [Nitrosopumilus sp.]|nr:hypothetical protein [Nitrosopumilus sp.]MBA3284554.1 hypothetical protein [Nitrosopumilus sp.]